MLHYMMKQQHEKGEKHHITMNYKLLDFFQTFYVDYASITERFKFCFHEQTRVNSSMLSSFTNLSLRELIHPLFLWLLLAPSLSCLSVPSPQQTVSALQSWASAAQLTSGHKYYFSLSSLFLFHTGSPHHYPELKTVAKQWDSWKGNHTRVNSCSASALLFYVLTGNPTRQKQHICTLLLTAMPCECG